MDEINEQKLGSGQSTISEPMNQYSTIVTKQEALG